MSAVAEPTVQKETQSPALGNWMKNLPVNESQSGSVGPIVPVNPAAPEPATPPRPPAAPAPEPEPAPAPVPEPSKPAAPAAEEDESKWPRSAKDWDAFKSKRKEKETALAKERDEIKLERDRLNEEIATLKKQGPSPELETLKKERDEYEQAVRLHAVENHPKFKAYFDGKTKAQIDMARRIVGEENADAVSKILALPEGQYRDSQLEDLMGNLTTMQHARLGSVVNALSEIQSERAMEISRLRENYEKLQVEQKTLSEKQATEGRSQVEKFVDGMVKDASDPKKGFLFFQKKEGDEGWNKDVDARVNYFKQLALAPNTPEMQTARAEAFRNGAAFPAVLKYAQEMGTENATLKAQIKALSAAQPAMREGGAVPAGDTPMSAMQVKPGARPMDVAGSWMKALPRLG